MGMETGVFGPDPSGFTETQISEAMGKLSAGVWERDEKGYWKDVEPLQAKRARAVELLEEEKANMKPAYVRPTGLSDKATKGFTGDEYAFVYRNGGTGTKRDKSGKRAKVVTKKLEDMSDL